MLYKKQRYKCVTSSVDTTIQELNYPGNQHRRLYLRTKPILRKMKFTLHPVFLRSWATHHSTHHCTSDNTSMIQNSRFLSRLIIHNLNMQIQKYEDNIYMLQTDYKSNKCEKLIIMKERSHIIKISLSADTYGTYTPLTQWFN